MGRVTFPDPKVQAKLGELATVALDIDDPANAELQRQYGGSGVPAFALVDAGGNLVHRWTGATDAEAFVAELQRGQQAALDPQRTADDAVLDRLLQALVQDDAAKVERAFTDCIALHPETPPSRAATLWSACERAEARHDWPALRAAAEGYLRQPEAERAAEHAAEAKVLAGVAEFEIAGTITPALQARIDELIAVLEVPFPGSTVGERLGALFGERRHVAEAEAEAWVDRINAAMSALRDVGPAAAPSLLAGMRSRPAAAMRCAAVLSWLRLPTTTDRLREELAAGKLPEWTRVAYVQCIAYHKDARCLPLLLECAAPSQSGNVRVAALEGVRDIVSGIGGTERQDVADTVGTALAARSNGVLRWALQAAFSVRAPLPLDALEELLDDRRPCFSNYTIADNALWILLEQLGTKLVDADGKDVEQRANDEVLACVRAWLRAHDGQLQWSREEHRYRAAR